MKISCKQDGMVAIIDGVSYKFNKAGEPIEVNEKHAEKLLKNSLFEAVDKPKKKEKVK